MAINGGSLTASSVPALLTATSVQLCSIPAGPCDVVLSNTTNVIVYVTAGVAATTANGFSIPSGGQPVYFKTYPGNKATVLNVIPASTPASGAVSWLVSSTQ